jgi:DNA repair exonuclease SbcCD ATPase subunit
LSALDDLSHPSEAIASIVRERIDSWFKSVQGFEREATLNDFMHWAERRLRQYENRDREQLRIAERDGRILTSLDDEITRMSADIGRWDTRLGAIFAQLEDYHREFEAFWERVPLITGVLAQASPPTFTLHGADRSLSAASASAENADLRHYREQQQELHRVVASLQHLFVNLQTDFTDLSDAHKMTTERLASAHADVEQLKLTAAEKDEQLQMYDTEARLRVERLAAMQIVHCDVIVIDNKVAQVVDLGARQSTVVPGKSAQSSARTGRHARTGVFPDGHLRTARRPQADERNQAAAIHIGRRQTVGRRRSTAVERIERHEAAPKGCVSPAL